MHRSIQQTPATRAQPKASGTAGGASSGAVQARGGGYTRQVQALAPDAQPDIAAQQAALAPVQMDGNRDGSKIVRYDFAGIEKVKYIGIDKFNVSVTCVVKLKAGKDKLTTELSGSVERSKSLANDMRGIIAHIEYPLTKKGQKQLVKALVSAAKKHANKPRKPEPEPDEDEDEDLDEDEE